MSWNEYTTRGIDQLWLERERANHLKEIRDISFSDIEVSP